ncbi:uncharacterized protein METZ01_LOCUS427828, partial [marine metagenome]
MPVLIRSVGLNYFAQNMLSQGSLLAQSVSASRYPIGGLPFDLNNI